MRSEVTALYDLALHPANFNFVEFLVAATTRGATRISIDTRKIKPKFAPAETKRRIDSILVPACKLAEVELVFDEPGETLCGYHMDAVIDAYEQYGHIKKLKSVLPHGTARYTVTLRDYDRYPQRNSNREAWMRFADDIGAMVIDDWSKMPIDLLERMALYCGAEMNWHVANGPAALCYFSDAPFTGFWKGVDERYHLEHKNPVGSQLPWLNDNQMVVWKDDTYANITDSFSGLGRKVLPLGNAALPSVATG